MSNVCQYVIVVYRDTDNHLSADAYDDWSQLWEACGTDLNPDIDHAWEIDTDDQAVRFTRGQVESVLQEYEDDAEADRRHAEGYFYGQAGRV